MVLCTFRWCSEGKTAIRQINDDIYSEIYIEDALKAILEAELKFSSSLKFDENRCKKYCGEVKGQLVTCDLWSHVIQKHIESGMNIIAEQGTGFLKMFSSI